MQPSEQQPERSRRVVATIAVLAILGLILAVLIASCAGGDDDASEPAVTSEAATTAAEAAPAESAPAETDAAETDEPETNVQETEPAETPGPATIVEAAAAAGSFATLLGLLEQSTLDATLEGEGPFTLFAPTDEAFEALPEEVLAALEENPTALDQVLTYHVVPEAIGPEAIGPEALAPGSLTTLEGSPLEISDPGGQQYAGDAPILSPSIEAGNGWLSPIGLVLLPPALDLAELVGDEAAAAAYDRANFVVFFDSGSADLDGDAEPTIAEAAAEIEALPDGSRVRLVGVADPTGDAAANLELSRERARAVQVALEQAAPGADVRYVVRAEGEEEEGPELANARRVGIVLIPG